MEYLDGGELFDRISEKSYTLTEADCRDFLTQICQGVCYLHSQNILHLDLKVRGCLSALSPRQERGDLSGFLDFSSNFLKS